MQINDALSDQGYYEYELGEKIVKVYRYIGDLLSKIYPKNLTS